MNISNTARSVVATIVLSALLVTGCTQQPGATTQSAQGQVESGTETTTSNAGQALSIVTTFPPLYAHVASTIDENDTVQNLVPAGTSVHTRQPKPSDILAMESADIIVTNGLGLEEFLDGYLDTLAEKGVLIVDTSVGVDTIEYAEEEHDEDHDEHEDEDDHDEHSEEEHNDHDEEKHEDEGDEDEHDHHHEGADPHIWLDPSNAIIQVNTIIAALGAKDPAQADFYAQQGAAYQNTLQEVDTQIKESIANSEIRPFIVFHDAYQYFLQAYDLADQQVGLVQEFHGDNPSQQEIAELIETIEANTVTTVYTEPQFNPSVVQRLEQETGVQSKEIDPIGDRVENDGYTRMILQLADGFTSQ